jgi:soluble lytic murein transglycosylase-like protein
LAAAPDPQHKVLAGYLARRYRVAGDATVDLVSESYAVGRAVGLDPLLILAVISVESRFNPIAESDMGAKGLMQVIPRFHTEKLAVHGGADAVLDPKTNILVGAQILKEYIRLAGGLEAGLQMYNGASYDPSQGYAQKVIAEKQRLEQALRGIRPSGTSA